MILFLFFQNLLLRNLIFFVLFFLGKGCDGEILDSRLQLIQLEIRFIVRVAIRGREIGLQEPAEARN